MKKFYIILLNIIFIVAGLIIFDYCFYTYFVSYERKDLSYNVQKYINSHKILSFDDVYKSKKAAGFFRDRIVKTSFPKAPVLIFGGSFGYGFLLDKEQSFSYKLSKLTNTSVYNRSIPSYGIQIVPYMLEKYNLEKEITPNPKYIIYVFIDNHIFRLYRKIMAANEAYLDIRYKKTKTGLELVKPLYFPYRFSFIRFLEDRIRWELYQNSDVDNNFDFMKLHFLLMKSVIKKKFPNSKLVILKYHDTYDKRILKNRRWKELEKEGIIVIDSNKLTGKDLCAKEFKSSDNIHPNEKAWDLIVPALVKKLEL